MKFNTDNMSEHNEVYFLQLRVNIEFRKIKLPLETIGCIEFHNLHFKNLPKYLPKCWSKPKFEKINCAMKSLWNKRLMDSIEKQPFGSSLLEE